MDGSIQGLALSEYQSEQTCYAQRSLRTSIGCVGRDASGRRKLAMTLHPASRDSGIMLRRNDLGVDLPLDIGVKGGALPLLAALLETGITNLVVEVHTADIPNLRNGTDDFRFLIDCAGVTAQEPAAADPEDPELPLLTYPGETWQVAGSA